ncbi:tRNA (adenosine(37)-N6)-threonylcarbamoyltransferase complex ATPase subunit type 1 TsaE [bacterium]|nr:tRNA (adenosine(37)-N6)-threonylcarbamoyltransferase complex ATPase subunit type 1 TsaE [bacterium]MBU1920514.1 tRNA (adenosine(37)-N6)-threonylcarbamoyltransferase complex ATPase subunit type 1 TsaE [bacterium]
MKQTKIVDTILTHSPEQTESWAQSFASSLMGGTVVALIGELGAGKTVIARGIGKGLGTKDAVISPTFNYVLEYSGRLPLYHADLYRIESADVFIAMGLDEYFERDGIFLIEWAERIFDLLPESALLITIDETDQPADRLITIRTAA